MSVAADGSVTNDQLHKTTGWRTIRAFEWQLEVDEAAQPGKFIPADWRRTFHHGGRFQIVVKTFCDLYLYVLVHNADGSFELLYPDPEVSERPSLVKKGMSVRIPPAGEAFRFSPPAGIERLRILAAVEPLPWATAPELFELKSGEELTVAQLDTLAQLKSVRSDQLVSQFKAATARPRLDGLAIAVRSIAEGRQTRGCEVEIIEPLGDGVLVSYTSAESNSKAVLVHEVALTHAAGNP